MLRSIWIVTLISVSFMTSLCSAQETVSPPPAPADEVTIQSLQARVLELENRPEMAPQVFMAPAAPNSVSSYYFMPVPADPTSLFFDETKRGENNLGDGSQVFNTGLLFRAAVTGSVQAWYDTGFVGAGAEGSPETIEIDGTTPSRRGFFDMAEANATFKFDLQSSFEESEVEQVQAYLEPIIQDGDITVRHVFGRAKISTINVLAGKYWTAWGDEGTIPKSLLVDAFPTGAIAEQTPAQLRFAVPFESGWVATMAIQEPTSDDFAVSTDAVDLQRAPELAGRLRYFDDDFFSVSFGGLLRFMGQETPNGDEDFTTGWGLSATARMRVVEDGALMMGVVGGQGISGAIVGMSDTFAAAPSANGELEALANYGMYGGFQYHWTDFAYSTIAYGIAQGEGNSIDEDETQTAQNGWINLIYRVSEGFAFGLEYQYGERELVNDDSGDNHRFSLVVALTAAPKTQSTAATTAAPAPAAMPDVPYGFAPAPSAPAPVQPAVPSSPGVSRFMRL
jgi:hypothetical protein